MYTKIQHFLLWPIFFVWKEVTFSTALVALLCHRLLELMKHVTLNSGEEWIKSCSISEWFATYILIRRELATVGVCVPKVFYPLAAHKDAICQIKPCHTFYFWYFPSHPPWYGSFGGKRGFMMFMKKSTLVFHLGILAQLSAMKQPILESRTSNSNLPI